LSVNGVRPVGARVTPGITAVLGCKPIWEFVLVLGVFSVTRVAVEPGLGPFEEALKEAGFDVVELKSPESMRSLGAHAVVVSGLDSDFMGMTDSGEAPVVTAAGRTPAEVVDEVRRSLGPRE